MRLHYPRPATRPRGIRDARILLFPGCRSPAREDAGEGPGGSSTRVLEGLKVLVVEDDFIVAFDMQSILEEQGALVLGPAASVTEAQALLQREVPDLAVLDVNLNGEYVFPVAEALVARGVPFVFATAYADDDRLFPGTLRAAPRLAKPVLPNVLVTQLDRLKR